MSPILNKKNGADILEIITYHRKEEKYLIDIEFEDFCYSSTSLNGNTY